jgi:FkbM family methyltransferase
LIIAVSDRKLETGGMANAKPDEWFFGMSEEFPIRSPEAYDSLNIAADRRGIYYLYLALLGREPESEASYSYCMGLGTLGAVRNFLMSSEEFRLASLIPYSPDDLWVCASIPSLGRLWLNLHDTEVSRPCLVNAYEPEETNLVRSVLKPGDTFVDVGANIGWFTLVAASRVGSTGQVVAIEPDPTISAHLRQTVAENNLASSVFTHALAAWSRCGIVRLVHNEKSTNQGHRWLQDEEDALNQGLRTSLVPAISLDTLLCAKTPTFIKIDAEGSEYNILVGSARVVEQNRPFILAELYPEQLRLVSRVDPEQVLRWFIERDYNCFRLGSRGGLQKVHEYPTNGPRHAMFFFRPNERGSH